MNRRLHYSILILLIAVGLLHSCPASFLPAELSVYKDIEPPEVKIITPVQGSYFESTVTVSGTVRDISDTGEVRTGVPADFISSCYWGIQGELSAGGDIEIASDGTFSFTFSSFAYTGQIVLTVTAEDLNGNISSASIILAPDQDGPFLSISSPGDYSEYATMVTLAGSVVNSLEDGDTTEVVSDVSYRVPGSDISGFVSIDSDGRFSTTLNVSVLDGSNTIEVTAEDLNGNETMVIITIVKPEEGGDISGFTVTPGNRQVTIEWDEVQGAVSYSLSESNYGLEQTDVTSPYIWEGLENGSVYSFELTASLPGDGSSDAVSSLVSAMPLSSMSLTPWVRDVGFRTITIEWWDSPDIDRYLVERAESPDGPWEAWRNTAEHLFTDDRVAAETLYYYRVSPASYLDIVSNPTSGMASPFNNYQQVARIPTDDSAYDVVVHDDKAFISVAAEGTFVADISDPVSPGTAEQILDYYGMVNAYTIDGNNLFIVSDNTTVSILDITDCYEPTLVSTVTVPWLATGVDVSGDYLAVGDWGGNLTIANVTNRSNPSVLNTTAINGGIDGLDIEGDWVYMVSDDGLTVADIGTPESPVVTATSVTNASCAIDIDGTTAYLAESYQGLAVTDVTAPSSPGAVAATASGAHMKDVVAVHPYVYLNGSSFYVIDAEDPANPEVVVTRSTPSYYNYGLYVDDGFAYVACDTVGVVIFSVADARHSAAPEYVASMSNHEILSFDGSRACSTYWTGSEGRAYITDLSGSSSPELIFNGDTNISEIEVCGDYAFIANRADGLAIIDISDPANPSEPIFVETAIGPNYSAEDVDVAGEYAYIANYYGGLAIVDLADPTAPGALRIVNDGYYANAIEIQEGWGFVAGGRYDKGLVILDVSDPDNPGTAIVTNLDDHIARDITIWNDLALVAVDDVGLAIVDVSDPENPGTPRIRVNNG